MDHIVTVLANRPPKGYGDDRRALKHGCCCCCPSAPLLALIFYAAGELYRQAAIQAQENARHLGRLLLHEHHEQIESARHLLTVLAKVPEVRAAPPARCGAILADIRREHPIYANLGVIRPDGEVVCSAVPSAERVRVADRPYFQRALATRRFVVGEYQIGRITGKPVQVLALPVTDGADRIRAVVFAALDAGWLNRAAAIGLPAGASVTLLDADGTVLTRYPEPEKWVGRSALPIPAIREALERGGEGTFEATGLDGVRKLYGYASHRSISSPRVSTWVFPSKGPMPRGIG